MLRYQKKGLIFTNHHCGYGAIQKLSDVEHDYLKNGFAANKRDDELYADGLTVSFLRSMTDVTSRIVPNVPLVLSEIQRELAIDSISNELIREYEDDPFTHVRVVPFYSRNKYYMAIYDVFRDVRLVVAPPSSVGGKFGVIPITGCGRGIQVISLSFVSMPERTTSLQITVKATFRTNPNM